MTNRMKRFMNDIVAPNESAFIAERCIHDNVLLSHELEYGYHKDNGPARCVAKVDIRKAYDT